MMTVPKPEIKSDNFIGFEVVDNPDDISLKDSLPETEIILVPRVFPTAKDYQAIWTFFEELKIEEVILVRATYEAEAMCARLVRDNLAQVCLTEDSDSLAFLCPRTIFHFRKENQCMVDLSIILQFLEMSPEKFQDFCILMGCDFSDRLPLVGPFKLMSLHKK